MRIVPEIDLKPGIEWISIRGECWNNRIFSGRKILGVEHYGTKGSTQPVGSIWDRLHSQYLRKEKPEEKVSEKESVETERKRTS
jgi:hypothetical protein